MSPDAPRLIKTEVVLKYSTIKTLLLFYLSLIKTEVVLKSGTREPAITSGLV